MVSVKFDYRIICDNNFLKWLSKYPNKNRLISHLMHIKISSLDHRKEHNIILESEAKKAIENRIFKNKQAIGTCFKIIEDPEFLNSHKDETTKTIFYAIFLANSKPYRTYIFTADDKITEYKKNPHYNNLKSVTVKSGEDAIRILESYYLDFTREREFQREYKKK